MLLVDRYGCILLANQSLEKTFAYEPGELTGKPLEVLLPGESQSGHREMREAFLEYPATRQMGASGDLFGVSKDGRRIPLEIGLTTYVHDDETLALAFVLDLTERRRHEELLSQVAEAAPSGLLMTDQDGRIVMANGQARSLFGYQQEELIGRSIEMLIPERSRLKHRVYRGSFAQRPQSRAMGQGRDLFARRKNGQEFPAEIGLTPIETREGSFVVSTIMDLTERKRVEDQIRAKNKQLSRLNDQLTRFAFSISHDLKAPLSSITGLSAVALEDLESADPRQARESLTRIRDEAERLGELVENVLSLTNADSDDHPWAEVDVSALVSEVVADLAPSARQREVRLCAEVPEGLRLLTQEIRLRETLENLVSNGLKYSDPEKSGRFVKVSAELRDARFRLTVADNGIGIPPECHGQVFEMFRRFHGRHAKGSGLGLALVKKHVDRLGGEISFESSERGASFCVDLPVVSGGSC